MCVWVAAACGWKTKHDSNRFARLAREAGSTGAALALRLAQLRRDMRVAGGRRRLLAGGCCACFVAFLLVPWELARFQREVGCCSRI